MMNKFLKCFAVFLFAVMLQINAFAAPSIDRLLNRQIAASPLKLTPVVITFDHKVGNPDFTMLKTLGITGGVYLSELPIVLTKVNQAQFNVLRQKSGIRSLYANRTFKLLDLESRSISGVENLLRDAEVSNRNLGLPVSGKNIGISYIDTGIDATHPDLTLGENVVQNVLFPTAEVPLNLPAEFVPVLPLENQPLTDVEGGHGTFGAGVTAGTGEASGGLYKGMAPGAKLIGLTAGNDAGLSTFAIVQAMEYTLVNQFRYNIRVCNNSYGTTLADLPYDANDPINTATRMMHDRNITVVFAAGNDGEGVDKINPFSVAPWVISVGAAEKRGLGKPADFSSRGNDNGTGTDTPGQPADPDALPNLRPDITGSGVDIKSTRSKAPGVTNVAGTIPVFVGANDVSTIPPALLPFYTTSQGTSFSTPQVSGIVALMLEANPVLTPDEIVTVLRQTATPMPYEERVVGTGYVDAHNAVRRAYALAAVDHPANLFPVNDPNAPQISDVGDDQLGTTAQDIRKGKFTYDAVTNQIVYSLTVTDLSVSAPNMRWTLTSNFGGTAIFVTASIDETATTYEYGKITTLATGTQNQETIGAADSGEIVGDTINIRLSLDKINVAVGTNVLGTTSTATEAESQILIGSSLSGGLLLNSDSATGSDFFVGAPANTEPSPTPTPETTPTPEATPTPEVTPEPTPTPAPTPEPTPEPTPAPTPEPTPTPAPTATPTPAPTATPTPAPQPSSTPAPQPSSTPKKDKDKEDDDKEFSERYSGTINPGQKSVLIKFSLRRSELEAVLSQNQGNQRLIFELLDENGNVLRSSAEKELSMENLTRGTYYFRISGNVSKAVDFTIKSEQDD